MPAILFTTAINFLPSQHFQSSCNRFFASSPLIPAYLQGYPQSSRHIAKASLQVRTVVARSLHSRICGPTFCASLPTLRVADFPHSPTKKHEGWMPFNPAVSTAYYLKCFLVRRYCFTSLAATQTRAATSAGRVRATLPFTLDPCAYEQWNRWRWVHAF